VIDYLFENPEITKPFAAKGKAILMLIVHP
jgi:hypothetical protein